MVDFFYISLLMYSLKFSLSSKFMPRYLIEVTLDFNITIIIPFNQLIKHNQLIFFIIFHFARQKPNDFNNKKETLIGKK